MAFHFKYNASGAHRWIQCPVYKALEPQAPKRPAGEAAHIGTATHYLCEWALTHGFAVDEKLIGTQIGIDANGDATKITATTSEHSTVITVDENMVRGAAIYCELVTALLEKYPDATRHLEIVLELADDMGGSADCMIVTQNRIIVIDYKNGRNYVEAENNYQLAMYGVGALKKFNRKGQIKDVVMCIVQPNSKGKPVRTWAQTVDEMNDWAESFRVARETNREIERDYRSGKNISGHCDTGKYCKWCPSTVLCPAIHEQTRELANRIPDDPRVDLDEQYIKWAVDNGEAIIDHIEQCRVHMTNEALKGKQWEGYKLVERDTRRRVINTDELSKKLKHEDKMDAFDIKLKALSKLEKLYGRDYMAPYVEKPRGPLQLVPDSDPREEHNKSLVEKLPTINEGE